jgi:integrative and conjugative element protein (TIGR02256 family)
MLRFPLGTSSQAVVLSDAVLQTLHRSRQTKPDMPEAGGQLFATFVEDEIRIEVATGPRPTDNRGRMHFIPDRRAEQREIKLMYAKGFHYVGDWHTHPDPVPIPSNRDLQSISECMKRSHHDLSAFIMIIVGTAQLPKALHVSVNDGTHHIHIAAVTSSGTMLEAETRADRNSNKRNRDS